MNDEDRLTALAQRGIPRRHGAFLALVLRHSGYFLRRQHVALLRVVDGSRTTNFCRTLLGRHLAVRQAYAGHTQVYHVGSPALYDAIGEPNSRLRRPAEPTAVTQRLMTLDVLIAHREQPCLAAEHEKVAYFTQVVGVPLEALPGRLYTSERPGVAPIHRYFVDRTPVLLGADVTTFVYVPGWAPLGHFAALLNAYRSLFRHVPRARVLFCSADVALVNRAERMWRRRFVQASAAVEVADRATVLAHFRARQRFEARQFGSFSDEARVGLRRDLVRFSGPDYEQWYAAWRVEGDIAGPPETLRRGLDSNPADVTFAPFLLVDRYPFIGPIREAS